MADRGGKPEPIGKAVAGFLKAAGLDAPVNRAAILFEWAGLVGPQIARETTPTRITADGTLFVAVSTHAWMSELQLMEAQLIEKINARPGREPVRRIRWSLRR